MYLLQKPSPASIESFLADQARCELTYPSRGGTRSEAFPAGFDVDRTSVCLGAGPDVFNAACDAISNWQQFRLDWIEVYAEPDPVAGAVVAVLARALGLWVLNACRVVYVLEETEPCRRFGVAYGTLPQHAEMGEERFLVEWREDDSVWYEILAFSKPRQLLARLGYPYVRLTQRRFARDSCAAMKAAVSGCS